MRNIDIVRQAFAAFEQRDPELLIAIASPDVVFEPVTAQIAAGGEAYRGHDGLRRYLEDVARVWQELRPSPDTFYERDGGIVVATGRVYAWGAGRVVDAPAGWLWRIEGGLLVYGRIFETAAGALAAAGIEDATQAGASPASDELVQPTSVTPTNLPEPKDDRGGAGGLPRAYPTPDTRG
ncbi:nuclear transport factor 2 family protein [Baekduia alba]|uniref:nuclear transport factor 2 family protein n=1 Tax=Baekduia alba TaxID=2997333 RepID=UPI002341E2C9|nr:nuclear transport factor 2 family protein [Baekduia alba]